MAFSRADDNGAGRAFQAYFVIASPAFFTTSFGVA
jgi:hypothetical protein